jgi:hypothetical protein
MRGTPMPVWGTALGARLCEVHAFEVLSHLQNLHS